MKSGEEFLIFAQENDDGTYALLSGPQGRLVYEDGKLNSMQVVNERVKMNDTGMNIKVIDADAEDLCAEIRGYLSLD